MVIITELTVGGTTCAKKAVLLRFKTSLIALVLKYVTFHMFHINTNTLFFPKQSCALHDNIHKTHIILPYLASKCLILSSASWKRVVIYSM